MSKSEAINTESGRLIDGVSLAVFGVMVGVATSFGFGAASLSLTLFIGLDRRPIAISFIIALAVGAAIGLSLYEAVDSLIEKPYVKRSIDKLKQKLTLFHD